MSQANAINQSLTVRFGQPEPQNSSTDDSGSTIVPPAQFRSGSIEAPPEDGLKIEVLHDDDMARIISFIKSSGINLRDARSEYADSRMIEYDVFMNSERRCGCLMESYGVPIAAMAGAFIPLILNGRIRNMFYVGYLGSTSNERSGRRLELILKYMNRDFYGNPDHESADGAVFASVTPVHIRTMNNTLLTRTLAQVKEFCKDLTNEKHEGWKGDKKWEHLSADVDDAVITKLCDRFTKYASDKGYRVVPWLTVDQFRKFLDLKKESPSSGSTYVGYDRATYDFFSLSDITLRNPSGKVWRGLRLRYYAVKDNDIDGMMEHVINLTIRLVKEAMGVQITDIQGCQHLSVLDIMQNGEFLHDQRYGFAESGMVLTYTAFNINYTPKKGNEIAFVV